MQLRHQINQNPAGMAALSVFRDLQTAGHEAWFVGGGVRDLLLGAEPKDFDIATSARPDHLAEVFPGSNMVGAKFGVFIVRRGDYHVEVATFREEGEYNDRRRPDLVRFSTQEMDAQRRDFTVNALYFNPDTEELRDTVNGMYDLEKRQLRAVGEASARFQEDSLRMLRALRFAANLQFEIASDTWTALCDSIRNISHLSPERVREELLRGLTRGQAGRFLQLMDDAGALAVVLPEVVQLKGCQQPPEFHPEGDVFIHTKLLLENLKPDASPELAMAVLLHDIGKPQTQTFEDRIRFNGHDKVGAEMAEEITRRLRFSNAQIDQITSMIRRHMQFVNLPQMRTSTLKRFLSEPTIEDELELHRLDCLASHGDLSTYEMAKDKLIEFREEEARGAALPRAFITGQELINLGMKPGPAFGWLLREIYDAQLEQRVRSRDESIQLVMQLIKSLPDEKKPLFADNCRPTEISKALNCLDSEDL